MSGKSILKPAETSRIRSKSKRSNSLIKRKKIRCLIPDIKKIIGTGASKTVCKSKTALKNTTIWPAFNTPIDTPIVIAFQEALTKRKRDEMIDEIMLQKELATLGLAPDIHSVFIKITLPDDSVIREEYIEDRINDLKAELDKHSPDAKMKFSIYEEECDGGDLRDYLKTILEGQTDIEIIKGILKSVDQQVINLMDKIIEAGYINTDFKTQNICAILPRIIGLDFSRVFVINIDEIIGKAAAAGIVLDKQTFIEKSLLYMRIQCYITFITNFYRFNQMDYRKILGTVLTEQGVTEASVNDMVNYMAMFDKKNIFQHYPDSIDASPMQMLHHYWKFFLNRYINMTGKRLLGLKSFKSILLFAMGLRDDIIVGTIPKVVESKTAGSKSRRDDSKKALNQSRHNKVSRLRRSRKVKSRKSI
jgi:hypothetical protein